MFHIAGVELILQILDCSLIDPQFKIFLGNDISVAFNQLPSPRTAAQFNPRCSSETTLPAICYLLAQHKLFKEPRSVTRMEA